MRDGDRIVVVVYGVPFARAPRLISLVRSRVEMRLHWFGRVLPDNITSSFARQWRADVTVDMQW